MTDSPPDFSCLRHSPSALIARLRSVAESECGEDPWLAALCAQSANEIERLSAEVARNNPQEQSHQPESS